MQKGKNPKKTRPAQKQKRQPGLEHKMKPAPEIIRSGYVPSGRLINKTAVITGGDSGIGRAVAVLYAREGADIAIIYLNEDKDAKDTKALIEDEQRDCLLIKGDISNESFCKGAIKKIKDRFGKIDILVNNAAVQFPQENITDISRSQLEKTFKINIFSMFYLSKFAIEYMDEGSSIINSSSVTAYRGSKNLIDYSATKGAIVTFTRSLSASLTEKKIRVNAVAPGPIWTPLIPATFDKTKVSTFGSDVPMGRAGEPAEVAPCYLFLASEDSTYITGQVLHPNGGEIING